LKATKIYYQKCFNLGNYQNEVIGIELEIEKGERAFDVLSRARNFIAFQNSSEFKEAELSRAKSIINCPDEYTGRQIKTAEKVIKDYEQSTTDLPF
jgi:hypothetical protein